MQQAVLQLISTTINILYSVGLSALLMQLALTKLWPRYPFAGAKKGFFVFLFLLGLYGFIRILISGF